MNYVDINTKITGWFIAALGWMGLSFDNRIGVLEKEVRELKEWKCSILEKGLPAPKTITNYIPSSVHDDK